MLRMYDKIHRWVLWLGKRFDKQAVSFVLDFWTPDLLIRWKRYDDKTEKAGMPEAGGHKTGCFGHGCWKVNNENY